MQPTTHTAKIAIFPSQGLGDGLIYLILAHNLQQAGCQITVYHNLLSKLSNIFPDFNIEPEPKPNDAAAILEGYDLNIFNHHKIEQYNLQMLHKTTVLFIAFSSDYERVKLSSSINHTIQNQQHPHPIIQKLLKNHGYNLSHHDLTKSAADNVLDFCENNLQLDHARKNIPYKIKPSAQQNSSEAIIIHPDSSIYKKNWAPKKYLKLAKMLEASGEKVIFSVAPNEFDKWQRIINNAFTLTKWPLEELAYHLHAAKLFIGSDSGPGHLASLLGTPTVTIFARKRKHYPWRPGWSKSFIAEPKIKINFIRTKTHIRAWLSVKQVYNICQKALDLTKTK